MADDRGSLLEDDIDEEDDGSSDKEEEEEERGELGGEKRRTNVRYSRCHGDNDDKESIVAPTYPYDPVVVGGVPSPPLAQPGATATTEKNAGMAAAEAFSCSNGSVTAIVKMQEFGIGSETILKISNDIQQEEEENNNTKKRKWEDQQQCQLVQQQYQHHSLKVSNHDTERVVEDMLKGEEEEQQQQLASHGIMKDIWVRNILPFIGPGQFYFVAGVCKDLKEFYSEYFSTIPTTSNKIPKVKHMNHQNEKVDATYQHTFQSSAFSNLASAKYWDDDTRGKPCRLPDDEVCVVVAEFGTMNVMEWAHEEKGYPLPREALKGAARGGNMDVLIWLIDVKGFRWDYSTIQSAVFRGHFNIANYLLGNQITLDKQIAFEAVKKGRTDVLEWALVEHGIPWSDRMATHAATHGQIEVLKWAAKNGHNQWISQRFQNSEWPLSNGNSSSSITAVAAQHQQFDTVRWLVEEAKCEVDDTMICAWIVRREGNVEVLKWAHEHGCPWHEDTCTVSMLVGDLGMLAYARQNGCPWKIEAVKKLAKSKFDYQDSYDW